METCPGTKLAHQEPASIEKLDTTRLVLFTYFNICNHNSLLYFLPTISSFCLENLAELLDGLLSFAEWSALELPLVAYPSPAVKENPEVLGFMLHDLHNVEVVEAIVHSTLYVHFGQDHIICHVLVFVYFYFTEIQ